MCLIKYHPMKRSEGVKTPAFSMSAVDQGTWSASRPSGFTTGKTASGNHWIGGWMFPKAG